MKRVKEKLKSRRGASILLALLFLLVCVLVAMSVLMAAASNAGKIRSNREEQQKYFTLTSALNLIVDELEAAEYQGNYTVTVTEIPAEMDETQTPPVLIRPAYNEYAGEQQKGSFTCGLNGPVLPLANDLDALFYARHEPPTLSGSDVWMGFERRDDADSLVLGPYTLELAVDSPPEDGEGLKQAVEITVTVSTSSGDITLEAKLPGEEYLSMKASLNAAIEPGAFHLEVDGSATGKVTWKLDRITKGET